MPGEVKRMRMSEAMRLLEFWAEDCPPTHRSLSSIVIFLGGKPTSKSHPESTMTFDEFIAVAGGGEAVPDGK